MLRTASGYATATLAGSAGAREFPKRGLQLEARSAELWVDQGPSRAVERGALAQTPKDLHLGPSAMLPLSSVLPTVRGNSFTCL